MDDSRARPSRRVILLGASNLTRGISSAIDAARDAWGERLEILAAMGHGRSYGRRSHVLFRGLPGISECGLWEALAALPSAETAALVGDIGNDLLYGVSVERILEWINRVLDELGRVSARSVLVLPPICNLEKISTWRFRALVRIMYPKYALSSSVLSQRALELDSGLRDMARDRNVALLEPRPEWYGFDPIHIRRNRYAAVWKEAFAAWGGANESASVSRGPSWKNWIRLRTALAERVWLGGVEWRTSQPVRRLGSSGTISLY